MLHVGKLDKYGKPTGVQLSPEERKACDDKVRKFRTLQDSAGVTVRKGIHIRELCTVVEKAVAKAVDNDGGKTRQDVKKVGEKVDGVGDKLGANTAAIAALTKEVRLARNDPEAKASRTARAKSIKELHKSVLKLVKTVETCAARELKLSSARVFDEIAFDVAVEATKKARLAATEAIRIFIGQHPDEAALIMDMRSAAVLASVEFPASSSASA